MLHMRVSACLVAGIVLAVPLRAQTRPNFAGKWTLVMERSTPPTPAHHQRELTIAQDMQTVTLMLIGYRSLPVKITSDGAILSSPAREEVQDSAAYVFDGAEHPTPQLTTPGAPTTVAPPTLPPSYAIWLARHEESTYRAIWTRDQLVIMTRTPTRTSRKALSLDADGMLVLDNITLSDPPPNGPTQPAPVPLRSVYRKAS